MAESKLAILCDSISITLGTLASVTAVTTVSKIDTSRLQGFRVTKTEWFINRRGATSGDDPVVVGYAFGLTSTQISESLTRDPQSGSVNAGDVILNEETMRPIFPMASFQASANNINTKDGVTKPGWSAPEGGFLNWYAFNFGGGALTTGGTISIHAKHYGVWLRD